MKKGLSPFLALQEACNAQGVSSRITAFRWFLNQNCTRCKDITEKFKYQVFFNCDFSSFLWCRNIYFKINVICV